MSNVFVNSSEKLKEDNPDIDLIYKMFKGENYSLEDYPIETPIFT